MTRRGGGRKSDWTSERVAGGTDDGHGDRHEQSNEASTEPRRHPMPNRTDEMASRWDRQAEPRKPPRHRRISPSVVSMRQGG